MPKKTDVIVLIVGLAVLIILFSFGYAFFQNNYKRGGIRENESIETIDTDEAICENELIETIEAIDTGEAIAKLPDGLSFRSSVVKTNTVAGKEEKRVYRLIGPLGEYSTVIQELNGINAVAEESRLYETLVQDLVEVAAKTYTIYDDKANTYYEIFGDSGGDPAYNGLYLHMSAQYEDRSLPHWPYVTRDQVGDKPWSLFQSIVLNVMDVESLELAPKGIYVTVIMDDVCETVVSDRLCIFTNRYNLFADSKSNQFKILEKKVLEERPRP